jgi:glutathione S-transferase
MATNTPRLFIGGSFASHLHTISLAPCIALEEVGVPYEPVRIDFGSNAQRSAEYLAVNPKGRVPALTIREEDGLVVLTETPALLGFIARRYGHATEIQLPSDDLRLARMESFMAYAPSYSSGRLRALPFPRSRGCRYLCSTVHVAHAHKRRGARWSDDVGAQESMAAKVPANMCECFELIEADLLKGPWVMGSQYSPTPVVSTYSRARTL